MLEIYENSIHLSLKKSDYGKALREGILASKGENILIMNIDHLWDTNFFHWAWKNKIAILPCQNTRNTQEKSSGVISISI